MSDPTAATIVLPDSTRSFFGHPRGLVTCFMVEFFERFTYYGMRSMLVLFLSAAVLAANPGFGVDGQSSPSGEVSPLLGQAGSLGRTVVQFADQRVHRTGHHGQFR